MEKQVTCIGCPMGCLITVSFNDNQEIIDVSGQTCKRGEIYAKKEVTSPTRILTSLVRIDNGEVKMLSVKTISDIPKNKIFDCIEALKDINVKAPVTIGDVIVKNICDTGVDLVATKNVNEIK